MSKPVITFVSKVLRNGLLRYIQLHMSRPVVTFLFKVLRNGLLGYIHLHMSKRVITFVFKVLRNGLLGYILLHMSKPAIMFVFQVLQVFSSMAMAVWKCLMPWLVQDHSKNVPKLDLTKWRRKSRPIPQRNEKRLKKPTPCSEPQRYGDVTIALETNHMTSYHITSQLIASEQITSPAHCWKKPAATRWND